MSVSALGSMILSRSASAAVLAGLIEILIGPLGFFQSSMKETTPSSAFRVAGPWLAVKAATGTVAMAIIASGVLPWALATAGRTLASRPVSSISSEAERSRPSSLVPCISLDLSLMRSITRPSAMRDWPRRLSSSLESVSTLVAVSRR